MNNQYMKDLKNTYPHTDLSNEFTQHIHIEIGDVTISIVEEYDGLFEYSILKEMWSKPKRYQSYGTVVNVIERLKNEVKKGRS